jgi:hypothetical protein
MVSESYIVLKLKSVFMYIKAVSHEKVLLDLASEMMWHLNHIKQH